MMKPAVCVLASVLGLSACNKGPEVELHNATGNQVANAVAASGVMNGDTMIEPGLWQSKVTVLDMNIPGMPAEYAGKMKQSIAESRNETSSTCVKPEDVKKPKEGFFGADKSCRYDHFTMGGGKIDIAMVCKNGGSTQNSTMSGSYTPTTYSMDMAMKGAGSGMSAMSMKMHVDSRRVGECTGKEG